MSHRPRARLITLVACSLSAVLVLAGIVSALRSDSATQVVTTYTPADPLCSITDLGEVSGMAVRQDQLWVMQDKKPILYRLDDACAVSDTVDLKPQLDELGARAIDLEDLALGNDGTLWLADTGGNNVPRSVVTLFGWRSDAEPVRQVTLRYPDGEHDVEAVLIDSLNRATLVTKVEQGKSRVFTTATPIHAGMDSILIDMGIAPMPVVPGSQSGSRLVTGGAVSPSGVNMALRTYGHALEYDTPDNNLAKALVQTRPRVVALPQTPQGEAISYNATGTELLTTGEGSPVNVDRVIITRTPVT